ncbi:Glutamine-fructose-6-phosphate aminotransferase [Venturia nashicola]|uniref:Glutamine-fructose-6-phosphate aminotransferase n=1 Tax=Venturia nashicola TaxID=86259 RepID=A0A4Z1PHN3_9PEZI|nr:glutamine-fructose-6-phosphate aminotransferase [Venturia nashicola]TLD39120.1 Glutamine-fructose-6-phosphate aminotransferase [Venturia nashicola]
MLTPTRCARDSLRSLNITPRPPTSHLSPILRHTTTRRLFSNPVRLNQGLEPNKSSTINDEEGSPRKFTEEEWQEYWANRTVFEKLSAIHAFRDRRFPPEKQRMLEILTQINLDDLEFRNVGVLEHGKENEKCYRILGATTARLRSIGGFQPEDTHPAEATFQAKAETKEKKKLQDVDPRDTSNPWNEDRKAGPSAASQSDAYETEKFILVGEKITAALRKEGELFDAWMESRGLGDWRKYSKGPYKKLGMAWTRREREVRRADFKGDNDKKLKHFADVKKVREDLKSELQSVGVDLPELEKLMKSLDVNAEIVKMMEWCRSLSRPLTKAEEEELTSLVMSMESLLPEAAIPAHRDNYVALYTEHRRQKLQAAAETPLEKLDIEALSVAQLEDRELVVDELQHCIWPEHAELRSEFPNQSQEWFGLLQYNATKIYQALKCLAEFYRIALWLKEMDRTAVPDAAKKAKADKYLDEWANLFDERPAPGERLLPINQRLGILMERAMEQVKKDIKLTLLTHPPKEPEKKNNWNRNGQTPDMLFRKMRGAFKPSPERAKAEKLNEDYRAQLEAQEAKIAAAKWKKENGSKPPPSGSKPKSPQGALPGAKNFAAPPAAKRSQTLRSANSPRGANIPSGGANSQRGAKSPTPDLKYFARKGGRFGKGGKR